MDPVQCPSCGEEGEVDFDPSEADAGEYQFVQDCAVCCRPWAVSVRVAADGDVSVAVDRG